MARGQVITIFAAKGGCGKTVLATNLATVLHADGARRVCLVDLDLEFGDAAGMLDLYPDRSLADGLDDGGLVHPARISSLTTRFRPGFDCLLAPVRPGDADRIPATLVTQALTALRSVYDFIVVDTSGPFSARVLAALDAADRQVLVTVPERPALRHLRRALDVLDLLPYDRESQSVVINKSDVAAGLLARDVAELVGRPIAGRLPSRRDVPASINRGVPLAAADPEHEVSDAVRRLARLLVPGGGRRHSDRSGGENYDRPHP